MTQNVADKLPADNRSRVQIFGQRLIASGVLSLAIGSIGLLLAPYAAAQAPPGPDATSRSDSDQQILPFFRNYCAECHGNGAIEGDFDLERYANLDALKRDRYHWTKALKLLRFEVMPPASEKQPPASERANAMRWLDHQLFFVDCNQPPDPGRVTVRRLNRAEYNNTIRDLLGVDFQPADDFPSDETGHGFDNISDLMTVPPLLLEKYLDAAEAIANKAIRVNSPLYERVRYAGKVLGDNERMVRYSFEFPRAGVYVIRMEARQDGAVSEPTKVDVRLGNGVLHSWEMRNTDSFETFEHSIQANALRQNLSLVITNSFDDSDLPSGAVSRRSRRVQMNYIELEGPLGFTDDERRAQPVVRVVPEGATSPLDAARTNLREFLPRAFRRHVTDAEVERCVGLAQRGLDHGDSFEDAMKLALQGILVSPEFLFRVEGGRRREGAWEYLDDFALASRLSYFLWSSMPDDELFRLARENKLHQPAVLNAQTLRLLNDPRANALIANFAGQWLGLRRLASKDITPDASRFPEFTDELRMDLWKETELFFGSILRSNSSVYELINGRYTFLNDRLARHYGIEGVSGVEFRRFEFTDQQRAGVITQGSILTLTSHPDRTSPVKRGEWVLTNLLGDKPPDPPPSVPALERTKSAESTLSLRQQMERHRADLACSACHKVIDAIGFGLENFDPIGRWRDRDESQMIDARGALASGETFDGPKELIAVLNRRKADFGRCLTEKMLTYALGRGVEWFDKCAVDEIMSRLEEDDHFATLILAVVSSGPFQMRRFQTESP